MPGHACGAELQPGASLLCGGLSGDLALADNGSPTCHMRTVTRHYGQGQAQGTTAPPTTGVGEIMGWAQVWGMSRR